MSKALLVIDVQNDYFPEGKFPLWNTHTIEVLNAPRLAR
jgi:nicotinamidase-related amidase